MWSLAILGLWAVVVAQPLFDLISRNPEFLVAHHASRLDIIVLAAGLVLAGPAVLMTAVWLAGLAGRRPRRGVATLVVATLVAALAAQIASRLGAAHWGLGLGAAIAGGLVAAIAWHRAAAVRMFAAVLSIAALVTPVVFLTRPAIRRALAWNGGSAQPRAVERVPPPAGSRADTPVVIVVLDEMPLISLLDADRRIDPDRYPSLAALARESVWYRNATTVSDYTRWAVPSIMSGKYPSADLVPTSEDHPDTLFTLLARTHRIEGREGITHLCPANLCGAVRDPAAERAASMIDDLRIMFLHVIATPDLRASLPDLAAGWAGFGPIETREERRRRRFARRGRSDKKLPAFAFIEGITARDRQPTLYFLHSLLPHYPHLELPSGQRNGTRAVIPGEVRGALAWTDEEWGVIQFQQRQLMQMGSVDTIIGRFVRRLKEAGLYERALVVLTADHGVAFQAGAPRRSFTEETAAAIMRVPLIIKYPAALGIPPSISDRNVEVVDIAPTVADVLGVRLSWRADGVSLLDTRAADRPTKRMYYDSAHRMRSYGPEGPDIGPLLRRKVQTFAGAYSVPRPPRFTDLVGRPLEEVRVENGGGRIEVERAAAFTQMNLRGDPVPFDVAGRIDPPAPRGKPVFIAVAVNGIIRAVTRTWDSEPGRWLATPPLDAWRNGANELEVFVVEEDARGVVLRKPSGRWP